MATTLEVLEIQQAEGSGGKLVVLALSGNTPGPGQYLLAETPDALLPVALYPAGAAAPTVFLPAVAVDWLPGMRLTVRGPFGRGFQLPEDARQVALLALEDSPLRLIPLATLALQRGASVVLHTPVIPSNLPLDVEILPLDQIADTLAWADYLGLDIARENLPGLAARLGTGQRHNLRGEALVIAPMPCAGLAECAVCAVRTRGGVRFACKDGPVFGLRDLLGAG